MKRVICLLTMVTLLLTSLGSVVSAEWAKPDKVYRYSKSLEYKDFLALDTYAEDKDENKTSGACKVTSVYQQGEKASELCKTLANNAQNGEEIVAFELELNEGFSAPVEVWLQSTGSTLFPVGGGFTYYIGKDYRVFRYNDGTFEAITPKTERKHELVFKVETGGVYVVYFNPNVYSYKYYLEEPTGHTPDDDMTPYASYSDCNHDDALQVPTDPTKKDSVFIGWKVSSGTGYSPVAVKINDEIAAVKPDYGLRASSYQYYYANWCPLTLAKDDVIELTPWGAQIKNATIDASKGKILMTDIYESEEYFVTGKVKFDENGKISVPVGETVKIVNNDANIFLQKKTVSTSDDGFKMTIKNKTTNKSTDIDFDFESIYDGDVMFRLNILNVPTTADLSVSY